MVAIFFAAFYLLSTIGVAVNVHYCGGNLKSVALIVDADTCCADEASCGCCQDETYFFQYDVNDVLVQPLLEVQSTPVAFIAIMHLIQVVLEDDSEETSFYSYHSPPPESAMWLKYCSLTYYG